MNLFTGKRLEFITLTCLIAFSMPAIASNIDWQKNLADAYHELAVGNTEKAVDLFSRKVNKYPDSGACHAALGMALKRLGRKDEAKSEFRKAIEVEPSYPDSFYELAVLQESDRDWHEAALNFKRFLELKPDASERRALSDRIQYCLNQSPNPPSRDLSMLDGSIKQAPQQSNIDFSAKVATTQSNDSNALSKVIGEPSTINQTDNDLSSSKTMSFGSAIKKAFTQSEINRPIRDKWALIVGIGSFGNPNIPHLKYASKDACDLYDYLVHDGNFACDHVRLLLNEKATQRRIMSELGNKFLARLAKPDDLILLFFSTHGSPSQMDIRGKNYLVAYDSDPEDLFATGIEMQKILECIQSRVLSDRVMLVLDACHSGGAEAGAKGITRIGNFDAQALAEGSGQMVICSSQHDQQSWESKRYENGVFTRSLLNGLRQAGPKAPLSRAFGTTQQLVQDEVREDHPGARQTPELHSKWNGNELVIQVPASAPQKIPPTVASDLEPDSSGSRATIQQRPSK